MKARTKEKSAKMNRRIYLIYGGINIPSGPAAPLFSSLLQLLQPTAFFFWHSSDTIGYFSVLCTISTCFVRNDHCAT